MKPYFDDGQIQIWNSDCRDVLPLLEPGSIDLVLTDPPYGIAINTRNGKNWRSPERPMCVVGDDEPFDPGPLLEYQAIVLWGANHYCEKLPGGGRWLIWDKRDGSGSNMQSDCELAWARGSGGTAARLYRCMWNGAIRDQEKGIARSHPTQKPIDLMRWCMGFYPNAQTILDPFMGSGTTLRAAKDLGRKAIGIEIEEKYCAIAVERLRQGVLL